MPNKYTDKKLIGLLKVEAENLGRTPTVRDIKPGRGMPSSITYIRTFGSWNKALEAAGLSINSLKFRCTDDELIELLQSRARNLGRTPTVKDVGSDNGMPSVVTYARTFGSWNQALEAAGLSINNLKFEYTDEELIKLLQSRARNLGRTPTVKDVGSDNGMPSAMTYIRTFSSWNEALEIAGFSANQFDHTDEELIDLLKAKARSLGRTPTVREVNPDNDMPSAMTYINRFGSWNQALKAAGLTPNRRGRHKK